MTESLTYINEHGHIVSGALYHLDIKLDFVGAKPLFQNRAAPEAHEALCEAVDAAKAVLLRHGFTLAHSGYGCYRTK
jgi:hypothetical protein